MATATMQRIDTFDDWLTGGLKRINAAYGGAGSGKSVAVAQELVLKLIQEDDIRILITRKTLPSLRLTAYQLIKDILAELQIPYDLNKSEMVITYGKNKIYFKSMDDPEKVKSAEFNYIWVEEATEITEADLTQLDLRLRRQNKNGQNRIFLTFNPIDAFHHLITRIVQGNRDDVSIHHSTYKDNPFCTEDYKKKLESLIDQNPNVYRIYTLGEPGILENTVYTNYEVGPGPRRIQDIFFGLDFGFNNETALLEIIMHDGQPYLREVIYESGLTNTDLIGKLNALGIPKKSPMYGDAAEPQRIQEIRRAGFNIHPSVKGPIEHGIDFVKRYRLRVNSESIHLINEIRGYQYRMDKDGHVLEEPVKFRDHLMDAMRYAMVSHLRQGSGAHVGGGVTRKW